MVCLKCHTARPQCPLAFEETARFQAGQPDTASYEAALHELMVEHEGTFWTLGAEMEVRYRHDSAQWVAEAETAFAQALEKKAGGRRRCQVTAPSVTF